VEDVGFSKQVSKHLIKLLQSWPTVCEHGETRC